jgi:hypothetical protein
MSVLSTDDEETIRENLRYIVFDNHVRMTAFWTTLRSGRPMRTAQGLDDDGLTVVNSGYTDSTNRLHIVACFVSSRYRVSGFKLNYTLRD